MSIKNPYQKHFAKSDARAEDLVSLDFRSQWRKNCLELKTLMNSKKINESRQA